jgi:hypothetical protein
MKINKIIKINMLLVLLVTTFNFSSAQNTAMEKEGAKETGIVNKILNIFKNVENVTSSNENTLIEKVDQKKESVKTEKRDESKAVREDLFGKKEILCENKLKVNTKKEKINKQIKNQIVDKNKLVDSLMIISASTTPENKEILDEKVLKLESEVSEIIKTQKDVLTILNSSSTNSCTQNTKNNTRIKDLEKSIDIKADSINKIIKEDIKNLLKNVE